MIFCVSVVASADRRGTGLARVDVLLSNARSIGAEKIDWIAREMDGWTDGT